VSRRRPRTALTAVASATLVVALAFPLAAPAAPAAASGASDDGATSSAATPGTGETAAAAAAAAAVAGAAARALPERVEPAADLPGGPRRTSIVHAADDASTAVLVHGLGSSSAAQARENRSYRHSDLQPTGRFVAGGEPLTITVPEGSPAVSVSVGLEGTYAAHNGGVQKGWWSTALSVGENVVTAPHDGMVHLVSTVEGGSAEVVVAGGRAVPVFVFGQTTNEALRAEMTRLATAPFIEIVGTRFFGDFQARTGPHIAAADVHTRVWLLDESIRTTNATYGLVDTATGVAKKAPHRIYVASADSSGGYANAGGGRVMFQVGSGAAADLFRAANWDQWGWWHEIGHTYQTPTYNWSGLGEVLVNVSPLHVQARFGWGPRLDSQVANYDRFFARPVDERRFQAEGNVWTRLFLFDHLRRAFGEQFYPRLNQELRVLKARDESQPVDDEAKRQLFAVTAARIADRDLREFFRQWGIPLDAETQAVMAELPRLEQPIWLNRTSKEAIREHELPAFGVPTGTLRSPGETVVRGQRRLPAPPEVTGLRDSDGVGTARVADHVLRTGSGDTGTVAATLVNDRGIRDVLEAPVAVTPGTSVRFRGISDRDSAHLALLTEGGTRELRLLPGTTWSAHPYFADREYYGATTYDPRGVPLESFSVQGQETAHAAAAAFDGAAAPDGGYVQVRHAEAASRLTRWDAGVEQPRAGATTQAFRIDGSRLVPVAAVPVPAPLEALPVDEPVQVRAGSSTPVPLGVETTSALRSLSATLTVTPPAGTHVDDVAGELATWLRLPGGEWAPTDLVVADRVTTHADGTVSVTLESRGEIDLPAGSQLRWSPSLAVSTETAGGAAALGWRLVGTVDGRAAATGS
jgi:hypothetical protein